MRVLGIESSGAIGSVSLLDGTTCIASRVNRVPNAHSEHLLILVQEVLAEANLAPSDLQRIAAGTGPGSFTGLRVGLALAQGLAMGLGIPLVGLPSLAAMARAAGPLPGNPVVCPLIDAGRGEVFVAAYDVDGFERMPPTVLSTQTVTTVLSARVAEPWLTVGAVASELFEAHQVYRSPHSDAPHAEFIARLAQLHSIGSPEPEVVPLYARDARVTLPNLPQNPLRSS